MKIKVVLSFLVFLILTSCYKDEETLPLEDFDSDMKRYMLFDIGSSWTYKVSDTIALVPYTVRIELQDIKTEIVESKDGKNRVKKRTETYFDYHENEFFTRTITDENFTYLESNFYIDDSGNKLPIEKKDLRVYKVESKFGTYYSKIEGPTYSSYNADNNAFHGDVIYAYDVGGFLNNFQGTPYNVKLVTSGEDVVIQSVKMLRYENAYSVGIGMVYHNDLLAEKTYQLISSDIK
ncbi:MAG: hypothetical protein N4A45_06520 [Flavobacteriales bacterium]|jgi:hypothetical protein|nr:hypothetical protein [Flavobacteriales bacterium]